METRTLTSRTWPLRSPSSSFWSRHPPRRLWAGVKARMPRQSSTTTCCAPSPSSVPVSTRKRCIRQVLYSLTCSQTLTHTQRRRTLGKKTRSWVSHPWVARSTGNDSAPQQAGNLAEEHNTFILEFSQSSWMYFYFGSTFYCFYASPEKSVQRSVRSMLAFHIHWEAPLNNCICLPTCFLFNSSITSVFIVRPSNNEQKFIIHILSPGMGGGR